MSLKLHHVVRSYNNSPHALVAFQDDAGNVVQNEPVDASALASDTQAIANIAALQAKADAALGVIALGQIQKRAEDTAARAKDAAARGSVDTAARRAQLEAELQALGTDGPQ